MIKAKSPLKPRKPPFALIRHMVIPQCTTTNAILFLLKPNFKSISKPYSSTNFQFLLPMASSIVAEYAKSKRSTCKTCSDSIQANALRLGVVTKDKQRGFTMTKWHHLNCFSFGLDFVPSSVNAIAGFDSLKSDDQEALKKLAANCKKDEDGVAQKSTQREIRDIGESKSIDEEQRSSMKMKIRDIDESKSIEEEQRTSKKMKLLASGDANIEIELALSDIKDTYKGATLLPNWKALHTLIFLEKDGDLQNSSKIAAFDFDGCLANTSVKKIGADAWSLMFPSIPDKLQKLYNDGFKLVIFTNESNIDRWKNKRQVAVDSKIGRLNNFIKHVNVPIQVFIACGFGPNDQYRKPKPGMWHIMEKHFNSGNPVDMDQSFYVGDAAGRKNDHSDADIKFAQAIGLKFYVPEEFFVA